jgi:hypothetical protein
MGEIFQSVNSNPSLSSDERSQILKQVDALKTQITGKTGVADQDISATFSGLLMAAGLDSMDGETAQENPESSQDLAKKMDELNSQIEAKISEPGLPQKAIEKLNQLKTELGQAKSGLDLHSNTQNLDQAERIYSKTQEHFQGLVGNLQERQKQEEAHLKSAIQGVIKTTQGANIFDKEKKDFIGQARALKKQAAQPGANFDAVQKNIKKLKHGVQKEADRKALSDKLINFLHSFPRKERESNYTHDLALGVEKAFDSGDWGQVNSLLKYMATGKEDKTSKLAESAAVSAGAGALAGGAAGTGIGLATGAIAGPVGLVAGSVIGLISGLISGASANGPVNNANNMMQQFMGTLFQGPAAGNEQEFDKILDQIPKETKQLMTQCLKAEGKGQYTSRDYCKNDEDRLRYKYYGSPEECVNRLERSLKE